MVYSSGFCVRVENTNETQERMKPADLASGRNLGKGSVEAASGIWGTV